MKNKQKVSVKDVRISALTYIITKSRLCMFRVVLRCGKLDKMKMRKITV